MSEAISFILQTVGTLLTFQQAEIYGIPGFSEQTLVSLDSTYEVEKQSFTFQVSTLDIAENDIKIDDEFTIEDIAYTYTFTVNKTPVPDLTGYSKLYVDFVSKTLL